MYDYVIVGAGSAGCVLAGRLSEDPGTRVLLLEAGPEDRKLEIDMPAAFSKLFKTGFDWAYETSPQRHLENRRLYWPRGKVLGGSSSINAMIYSRPGPADHTRWEGSGHQSTVAHLSGGVRESRHIPQPGPQRSQPGRRGFLPGHPTQWPTTQCGRRIP